MAKTTTSSTTVEMALPDLHGSPDKADDTTLTERSTPAEGLIPTTQDRASVTLDPEATTNTGCCFRRLPPWRLVATLMGCMLIESTLGVVYVNTNLMPYMTSYLRNVTGETSLEYSQMLWMSTTLWLFMSASVPLAGLLQTRMPRRLFFFCAIAMNAASFFGSYWALKTSFVLLLLVYSILQGIAQGALYPSCVSLVLQWFPNRKGLLSGIVMAGYGGGAIIWNPIATHWINPDNLQADFNDGQNVYFTQPELLERVPTCFLLFGGILTGVQLLCLVTLKFPDQGSTMGTVEVGIEKDIRENVPTETEKSKSLNSTGVETETDAFCPSGGGDKDTELEDVHDLVEKESKDTGLMSNGEVLKSPNYGPLDVLKSRATWTLWLNNLAMDYGYIFIIPFYKAYGLRFIHDDHLLTLVTSFGAVFNCVGRPVWGWLADRIGYLPCLLLSISILAVSSGTFLFTEMAQSATMFFIWICLMFIAFSGFYALQSPTVFTLFGSRYFVFSLGVIASTGVVSTLTSVKMSEAILETFGWNGLYLFSSALFVMAIVVLVSLLWSCGHPIPEHMRRGLVARKHRLQPEHR